MDINWITFSIIEFRKFELWMILKIFKENDDERNRSY